jgi:flagellin-like protein
MNIGKSIRKFRRNARAISPVIATLLMIAIAVVASLVTYAWVMGYMSFTQEKTGRAIQIQSVTISTIYVQNVGDSAVSFGATNAVFLNGAAVPYIITYPTTTGSLLKGETASIVAGTTAIPPVATTFGVTNPGSNTFKVTTLDGTFSQVTKTFP